MYRQRKIPTDPCNDKFMESYDSRMRERIGGWRDEGYSFSRISRLLPPSGFDVSAYIIEKKTKNYDTGVLEETEYVKESMIFLKKRGISEGEIKRRLHEEGINVDIKSIGYAMSKWESDESLTSEPKPATKRSRASKFYRGDNSIDFPGNNTNGSMPARPVRNRSGY
jgi:hypothetical protein